MQHSMYNFQTEGQALSDISLFPLESVSGVHFSFGFSHTYNALKKYKDSHSEFHHY